MFTLVISCLTTSNLLIHGPNISDFYAILPFYSIKPCFYHQSHTQLGVVFALTPSLHLSGVISPLISSSILGTYRPEEFIFWCPIFLPFHTVHGILKVRIVCHSLFQYTTFCQTSPPWPVHLGWPYMAWLTFIELDKAVVHVIRLACYLWLWFQSVCPLMPSLSAYCPTWVFLTLDVGYPLDHWTSKRVPEKHLFLLYGLCQSLWLCGSQ